MTFSINVFTTWARITLFASIGLYILWLPGGSISQSEPARIDLAQRDIEDITRRIWNKRFREARDRAGVRRPGKAAVNEELIGVTIWRLRDTQDDLMAERAAADTLFTEGERVRLSIEAPRRSDGYLYVIDREVYADGATSDPYLIFPSQTTPEGGNVVTAGKPVFVPAKGDEYPYFALERVRKDHLREEITIIVSPKPLKLPLGAPDNPVKLDRSQVARWEKQWGGPVKRWEERDGAGRRLSAAEKEADKGERRLERDDPMPQTLYLIKARPGAPAMFRVPLQIAP